jgi:hypothetical protein
MSDHRHAPDPQTDITDLLAQFPYLGAPHAERVTTE